MILYSHKRRQVSMEEFKVRNFKYLHKINLLSFVKNASKFRRNAKSTKYINTVSIFVSKSLVKLYKQFNSAYKTIKKLKNSLYDTTEKLIYCRFIKHVANRCKYIESIDLPDLAIDVLKKWRKLRKSKINTTDQSDKKMNEALSSQNFGTLILHFFAREPKESLHILPKADQISISLPFETFYYGLPFKVELLNKTIALELYKQKTRNPSQTKKNECMQNKIAQFSNLQSFRCLNWFEDEGEEKEFDAIFFQLFQIAKN